MKQIYNITKEYNVYQSLGNRYKIIDETKYLLNLNKISKLEISCNFCLGGGYYLTEVSCINIFKLFAHRDYDQYIQLFNDIKVKIPPCFCRNNNYHSLYLLLDNSLLTLKIDNKVLFNNIIEHDKKALETKFQIMSHDDTTYIKDMVLNIYGIEKYLLKQDNHYYTIKPQFYDKKIEKFLTCENDFEKNGFDRLSELIEETNKNFIKGIKISADNKMFEFNLNSNIKKINNIT